ncbi:hypothetical protein [Bradyrhizobium sp. DASA03007]|uniref:hypothetical protein n=1 Tax=unclassified Bradyrhizobium TaxID=2631580 RepID=UPI003F6E59C9
MTDYEWIYAVLIWVGYLIFSFTMSGRSTSLYIAGVNLFLFIYAGHWLSLTIGLISGWMASWEEQ